MRGRGAVAARINDSNFMNRLNVKRYLFPEMVARYIEPRRARQKPDPTDVCRHELASLRSFAPVGDNATCAPPLSLTLPMR